MITSAAIIVAVEEGRKVFVSKIHQYLLSANMAEVFTIFFAAYVGLGWPSSQCIVWINLVNTLSHSPSLWNQLSPERRPAHQTPRGRKSNFFDGDVFRNSHLSRIFKPCSFRCLWLIYTQSIKFKLKSTQMPLPSTFATLGLVQLLQPLTLSRFPIYL